MTTTAAGISIHTLPVDERINGEMGVNYGWIDSLMDKLMDSKIIDQWMDGLIN